MDVRTAKPMNIRVDASKTDQELVEEIVVKLRKIGDDLNENASFKRELTHMMKDCIKAVLRKRIKEKLCEMTSFMNVIDWIE